MNYAVKYYGLKSNPCQVTGGMGKAGVRRLEFWTNDQFTAFIKTVNDDVMRLAFMVLFYAGIRCGEMLALTPSDFDQDAGTLRINKTYHRYDRTDVITSPKTANSNRVVSIPQFLTDAIQSCIERIYGLESNSRIFYSVTPQKMETAMKNGASAANIPRITLHGLRHSHVSLLIDMGFTTYLIAERIGDSPDMVNRVYGHLYPNKHVEVANKLQGLVSN